MMNPVASYQSPRYYSHPKVSQIHYRWPGCRAVSYSIGWLFGESKIGIHHYVTRGSLNPVSFWISDELLRLRRDYQSRLSSKFKRLVGVASYTGGIGLNPRFSHADWRLIVRCLGRGWRAVSFRLGGFEKAKLTPIYMRTSPSMGGELSNCVWAPD